jgi:hypothetical protein
MASFNATIDRYRELLSEAKADQLALPNQNFDTGELTEAGQYKLTDAAYAKLLDKLENHYADMSPALRSDILAFYNNLNAPISTKTNDKEWARLLKQLDELKGLDLHVVAGQ